MKTRTFMILVILMAASITLTGMGVSLVTAQVTEIKAPYIQEALPLNPKDPLWGEVELTQVPLVAQLLAYPMSLDTTPRSLKFAIVHNGTHMAFYIEWDDQTMDVEGGGELNKFSDAVAIQFPVQEGELPYICMGDTANPVNIVMWKAGIGAENLVAGSAYGRDAKEREALGLQQVPTSPIEMLPEDAQIWKSQAVYEDGKWRVVLIRPTGSTHPLVPDLRPGDSTSIAFARWEGSKYERGGAKSTSGWYTVKLEQIAVEAVETVTQTQTVTTTQTTTETVTQTQTQVTTETVTVTETTPAVTGAVKGALVGLVIALIAAILALALLYRRGMRPS
ncbi:MAG: ethylbenzene dehydrogenase-related protein [Desulfurococcales archaeon]|nr:ethylbenzene dehydrogenase-related protein [Desulfurococcales archaeon]